MFGDKWKVGIEAVETAKNPASSPQKGKIWRNWGYHKAKAAKWRASFGKAVTRARAQRENTGRVKWYNGEKDGIKKYKAQRFLKRHIFGRRNWYHFPADWSAKNIASYFCKQKRSRAGAEAAVTFENTGERQISERQDNANSGIWYKGKADSVK